MLSGGFRRAEMLRGIELRLDRGDDGLGDFVLTANIGKAAVVALGRVAAARDIVDAR
jgi:hypothetical protein